jgi:hypothetical protein
MILTWYALQLDWDSMAGIFVIYGAMLTFAFAYMFSTISLKWLWKHHKKAVKVLPPPPAVQPHDAEANSSIPFDGAPRDAGRS